MKENEIYEKIYLIKRNLELSPYSHILNILLLSYSLLLKDFKTIEELAERLSIDSPIPCTHYELFRGISYLKKEAFTEANIAFKYALNIDPENPYPYLFKGIINLKEGGKANELFSRAIAFSSSQEKPELISITQVQEDEKFKIIFSEENILRKEFISIIEELIKSSPNDPILKISLAEAYYRNGNYEKIIPIIESIMISYPDYPHALYLMGKY